MNHDARKVFFDNQPNVKNISLHCLKRIMRKKLKTQKDFRSNSDPETDEVQYKYQFLFSLKIDRLLYVINLILFVIFQAERDLRFRDPVKILISNKKLSRINYTFKTIG